MDINKINGAEQSAQHHAREIAIGTGIVTLGHEHGRERERREDLLDAEAHAERSRGRARLKRQDPIRRDEGHQYEMRGQAKSGGERRISQARRQTMKVQTAIAKIVRPSKNAGKR